MLATVCKYLFMADAVIFASMIMYGKLFVFKKKHPSFVSDYCATMAIFIALYTVLALLLVWLLSSTSTKLIMFAFAFSPFLLGLLANYYTEKYYTAVQVLLIIASILFVF